MKIQGKKCTLTVAKDNVYYPLPYSEETVRLTPKGYVLPGVIGRRNRECFIETGRKIEGCFVTRLEYKNVRALFLLLFYSNETFDLLADRVYEKVIYRKISVKAFELRAENDKPFYMRFDVKDTESSFVEEWSIGMPSLNWQQNNRTYYYDGHNVTADLKTLPLIYRIEIAGTYDEKAKYQLGLYFPLSSEHYPVMNKIEKLTVAVNVNDGVYLDIYDLKPLGNLVDINCSDTVLCYQKFNVCGCAVLRIRNEKENVQVVL